MSFICLTPRALSRAAFPGLLVLLAACATRRPESLAPVMPVSATVVWRMEEGDIIKSRVYREPELSSEATVSANGTAFFPGLGRVPVGGLKVDSVEALLNSRYGQLLREPAVQVTMQRDITFHGQVRIPGVYPVDPNTTLQGLVAKAGGPLTPGTTPEILLETSDGRRLQIPREVRLGSIELSRRDAIYLVDRSFVTRNGASIQAASIIVGVLTTLVSLIVFVAR